MSVESGVEDSLSGQMSTEERVVIVFGSVLDFRCRSWIMERFNAFKGLFKR